MQTSIEVTDPITTLMEEHRLIERVLTALDHWSAGEDAADLPRFVELIGEFADTLHHGKEEDVLFRAMAEAGFPTEGGPIAVMLHEHGLGRRYIALLASPKSDRATTRHAARSYSALLRQHIQKEDRILYPMARRLLGPELELIGHRCAELDGATASRRRALLDLAEELIARYP